MAQAGKEHMRARYDGNPRTDPIILRHSRFDEQARRARLMEAADDGKASLQAEIGSQQKRKHQRVQKEAEIARSLAEQEVSRPRERAGSGLLQATTEADAPSVARVDSADATPDRRGFFIKGALRPAPCVDIASITRDEVIADMKAWGRSQTPPEFPAEFSTKRPVARGFVIYASCKEHHGCNAR